MPDEEYRALATTARRRRKPISQVVRESVRRTVAEEAEVDPQERIAKLMRYMQYNGSTGDIEELLAQIEEGRELA